MTGSSATPARPLAVLFIGGVGRSGSTLLDRLLGQQPGCVAVGELGLLWRSGLAENRLCGTPAHLAALLAIPTVEVHVVHLVRDSRAVVYSWQQRRRRADTPDREEYFAPLPAWRTGLQWMAINAGLSGRRRGAVT